MCKKLDPNLLLKDSLTGVLEISKLIAGLLYFLFRCAPKKYDSVVARLDWAKLDVENHQGLIESLSRNGGTSVFVVFDRHYPVSSLRFHCFACG